ncbi:DUF3073 domain-containing protein [Leucobacter sp. OH1287]|uniref:DUF3073 domain-containing protein n=1 Tax=Leucobacter sp. OH1287 TaxID=2491049 RepID=UPI000F5FC5DA|nr:DUF3073 domain-containing protein [Leucobacter sp. OH1287]RRD61296.1 DUF3073 domain-containing protein [Leucobacter sp. OH1287]
MGRGRQKAKHTKVARQLKYFSPNTDLSELERELHSAAPQDDFDDPWAEYAAKYNDDEYSDEDHIGDDRVSDEQEDSLSSGSRK